MRLQLKSILIILTVSSFTFGQGPGTAAVPFLLIGPSPGLGGSQSASAVFPTDDAFGFYYNPAQLGVFSHNNNFAAQIYTKKTLWLPVFNFSDLYLDSRVFAGGYVLENLINNIDLNIGIGYMRTFLNLGESIEVDEQGNEGRTFNSSESCDSYSIGAGFEYYAYFSVGFTYKKINSNLAPDGIVFGEETTDARADASAYDFGFLVSLPIISPDNEFNLAGMNLFSNAYLGYTMANMGDFVHYGDRAQSDPLPKTERFGLGLSIGLIQSYDLYDIKVVEFELANQANDLMISNRDYESAFNGDINFVDNIIGGESDDLVQVQNSFKINILESLYLGLHKMKGPGFPRFVKNTSFTFSTSGIFKILANDDYSDFWGFVINHIDLRYSQCNVDVGPESPLHGTKYQSIAIHFRNIMDLINND